MCAYLQTHHPPVATYFPVSLPPTPPPLWCRPPRAWLFRGVSQVPAVKMQRAMSPLQTMLLRHSVPSWTLLGKSFPGLAKCVRARAAPLTAQWAAGEEGSADRPARSVQAATVAALVSGGARRKGGGARSQLCALRRQAHFCSIPAARAQSPPATSPNPSHPALLRGWGHPLAFPLPAHWSQESRPRAASAGQWAQARAFSGFSSSSGSLALTVLEAKAKQSANGSLPSGIQLSFPL